MHTAHRFSQARALLGLLALMPFSMAPAATFHVAPGGSDSADGSISAPWATLQRAVDERTLTGGDCIYVRGGTYQQRVTLTRSGTDAAHPITVAAFPGETPVLDGSTLTPPDKNDGLITIRNASHLRLVGFEIANYRARSSASSGRKTPCGVYVEGACHDIEIRGNNIHHIGNHFANGNAFGLAVYGTTSEPIAGVVITENEIHHCQVGNSESLSINGNVDGFTVSNNRVHENTNIGIVAIGHEETCEDPAQDRARNGRISGNTIWECTSSGNPAYDSPCAGGIYVDGGTAIVIENNTSFQNDIGIELASEHQDRTTDHITVRNNFVWRNRIGGLLLGGAEPNNGGSEYNQIVSNTFWGNDTNGDGNGEIQFNHWCHHNTVRHNIVVAGAQALLCSNPVPRTIKVETASGPVQLPTNTDNRFDWNLWWAPGGATGSEWEWNAKYIAGFAAWRTATGQDSRSLFADPRLRNPSLSGDVDLRLRPDSPAVDAGDPGHAPMPDEVDIDRQDRLTNGRIDLGADELSPYASWRRLRFGVAETAAGSPSADPDQDGVSNVIEYAFGGDPLAAASCPRPAIIAAPEWAIAFERPAAATDITYQVQCSTDLANWTPASTFGPFGATPDTTLTRLLGRTATEGGERFVIGATPPAGRHRFFLRLAVSLEAAGP